jgi:hypothetical protein
MGRKHVVSLDLFSSSDSQLPVDMSVDLESREIDTSQMDKASMHLKWAAGPTGEFKVFAKNKSDGDFYELSFGESLTIDGSDSEVQIILNEMPFVAIRLDYVAGTGAADLTALLTEKSVGA